MVCLQISSFKEWYLMGRIHVCRREKVYATCARVVGGVLGGCRAYFVTVKRMVKLFFASCVPSKEALHVLGDEGCPIRVVHPYHQSPA